MPISPTTHQPRIAWQLFADIAGDFAPAEPLGETEWEKVWLPVWEGIAKARGADDATAERAAREAWTRYRSTARTSTSIHEIVAFIETTVRG